MTFTYRQKTVEYSVSGQGPEVIFLHGWGCDSSIFGSFVGPISQNHKVYCLDLPGFGLSEEPSEVWGTLDYRDMLKAFCDHVGVSCPALVGHSFGGRVAIAYAASNNVDRLVLVDAAGVKPRRSLGYYVKVYSYKAVKFFLLKVLGREDLLEKYRNRAGSSDYNNASRGMKAILSRVVNEDLCHLMPSIKAPTLLFWGTLDSATPLSDAEKMKKLIPDSGLVTVEGAAHFSFLQDPGKFLKVLEVFLK